MTENDTQVPNIEGQPTEDQAGATEEVDSDLDQLLNQVKQAIDERDEIRGQLLRTMADFQNYKKRVLGEKKQAEERANERFVADLLPVIDNFERALEQSDKNPSLEATLEGMQAIHRQLKSVLANQNLVKIPSVGQMFDPELHDAIGTVPSSEHDEGMVIEELEAGFKLGAKVIRPARVRVTVKP